MYLYIIFLILLIITIFEVFCKRNELIRRLLTFSYILVIIILFIFSFIRWERGTDWISYYNYFQYDSKQLNFLHHFENGFIILNFIVRANTDNYTILLLIEATIIYLCLAKGIKSVAIYPIFSLLCYFSIMKGGIFFVRQTIAVSIILLSVHYIFERKFYKFIILIIIATLIHRSSLFFLPCYWIVSIKKSIIFYFLILLITIMASFFILKNIGDSSISTGNPFIDAKINGYLTSGLENEMYGVTMSKETMLIRGFAKRAIFLLLICVFLWHQIDKKYKIRGLFNIYFTGICLYLILAPISIDFARSVLPFDLMDIYLLPQIIYYQKIKFNKIILFIIICALSVNRLYGSIELRSELFIPYKSIYNKELKVNIY